jgi:hypothetical protein
MKVYAVIRLAVLLPLLGACPSPERPPDVAAELPEAVEPATPTITPTPEADRLMLAEVRESGVAGEVSLRAVGSQTSVMISVEGAPPGTTMDAHIHEGNCREGGPVAVPLDAIAVDATGSGTSTSTADVPIGTLRDNPYFVQVHGPGGAPVACADLIGR